MIANSKALKAVMANITRPAAFGAIGGGGNILFGEEEDFKWAWVGTGACIWCCKKGIMASKTLTIGQKNKLMVRIISDATKFTLQKVRDITCRYNLFKVSILWWTITKNLVSLLMRGVDSPLSSQSVASQHMKMQTIG